MNTQGYQEDKILDTPEKYQGVRALFDADLNKKFPERYNRQDWIIIAPFAIRWTLVSEQTRRHSKELLNKLNES